MNGKRQFLPAACYASQQYVILYKLRRYALEAAVPDDLQSAGRDAEISSGGYFHPLLEEEETGAGKAPEKSHEQSE